MKKQENKKQTIVNWVSVDYRLPNPVTPVLVYSTCCSVCWYMQIGEVEDGKWFESGSGDDLEARPTHWAELPNPPHDNTELDI